MLISKRKLIYGRETKPEKEDTLMSACPYIMMVQRYAWLDAGFGTRWFDMGFGTRWFCGEALMEDGTIIPLHTEKEATELYSRFLKLNPERFYTGDDIITDAEVRPDYVEMFKSKMANGKTYFSILHEISKEIGNH